MGRLRDELRGYVEETSPRMPRAVTVVMTVKNDPVGCAATLSSLIGQSRAPNEIVVVDGGSTDGTVRVIRQYAANIPQLRLIEAPGANIARGRNIGTAAATHEIIATTDSGCRADRDWLANLIKPLEQDALVEFVAGFYRIAPRTLFEEVVGYATMRGQLEPPCPETFNPSARSMAYTKKLWSRAGGWPEWVNFAEDTLFDHKVRRMGARGVYAGEAIVDWRPRKSLRKIARQFYHDGTGRGHPQIEAPNFRHILRNLALVLAAGALCLVSRWFVILWAVLAGYFLVRTFHEKALRIVGRTQRALAYPLCLGVMGVVVLSRTVGYLVGSWERQRNREHYATQTETYLAAS